MSPNKNNFGCVEEGVLYRGKQPDSTGLYELKDIGIKTIINLRYFHHDPEISGIKNIRIPCNAWHPEPEDVEVFLDVMDRCEKPAFVHCQHGSDRTGTMVAIYRIVRQGWSYEAAIAELPKYGMHEIWNGIRPFIEKYEARG